MGVFDPGGITPAERTPIRRAALDAIALVLVLMGVAAAAGCGAETSSVSEDAVKGSGRPSCDDLPATDTSIVRNGSFEEEGALPCAEGCSLSGTIIAVGNDTAVPGWTVANNPVSVMGANYFPATDGVNCLALSDVFGPGSVFQDLTTEPGASYDISFDMAANPWNPETDSLDVYWDGQRAGSFVAVSTGSYPDNAISWTRHAILRVVATGATTRLQLVDTDWHHLAPLIDDVRVAPRVDSERPRRCRDSRSAP